ncbi:MAG: hypothetical protein V8Q71_01485 [Bacilli bacterium]
MGKILSKEDISDKLKYQDPSYNCNSYKKNTLDKHMAEAYIVSYADEIDAYIENIISYPRNSIDPLFVMPIYMKAIIVINNCEIKIYEL